MLYIELLPGVETPADVETCIKYGYKTLKLFPAGDLPVTYINSLKGPFSDTDYVTVGGVNIQNAAEFIKRGFIGVGIGNSLVPAGLIKNNDWAGVTNHVSNIFNIING